MHTVHESSLPATPDSDRPLLGPEELANIEATGRLLDLMAGSANHLLAQVREDGMTFDDTGESVHDPSAGPTWSKTANDDDGTTKYDANWRRKDGAGLVIVRTETRGGTDGRMVIPLHRGEVTRTSGQRTVNSYGGTRTQSINGEPMSAEYLDRLAGDIAAAFVRKRAGKRAGRWSLFGHKST
jgi:hypothetical protein